MLKEHLGLNEEQQSVQGTFEKETSKEQDNPTMDVIEEGDAEAKLEKELGIPPPVKSLEEVQIVNKEPIAPKDLPPVEAFEAETIPDFESHPLPEIEEPAKLEDLEEKLQEMNAAVPKKEEPLTLDGKPPLTLQELKAVISTLGEEDFAQKQELGLLKEWAEKHHYDETFKNTLSEAKTPSEAITHIEKHHKKITEKPTVTSPTPTTDPNEYFQKLGNEHKRATEELKALVQSQSVEEIEAVDIDANEDLITSLHQLIHAVEVMNNETYSEMSTDKENFTEWVKALAQKAANAGQLKPTQIKNALLKEIDTYAKKLQTTIEDEKEAIILTTERQQSEREQFYKDKASFDEKLNTFEEEQQRFTKQEETWAQQVKDEKQVLDDQQVGIEQFIIEHKDIISQLKEEEEQKKQSLTTQEEEYNKRREEIEQQTDELNKKQEELNTMESQLNERKEGVEREIEDKRRVLEEELTGMRNSMNDEKGHLEGELSGIRNSMNEEKGHLEGELQRRREEIETELSGVRNAVKEEEERLEKAKNIFEDEKEQFEKTMTEREVLVQKGVNRLLETNEEIKEQQENLQEVKEELDKGGFKSYLHEKLKNLNTDHVFVYDKPQETLQVKQPHFYSLIERCHQAIEANKFQEAQSHYDELKKTYDEAHLQDEEKGLVYDAIRDLYTTIRIAQLTE